ncbi:ATP-binding cassette domain-containing protein, partial [bacterium]|nr:ATP-binding cassette domain-containing protein [bacterium]NBW58730.1 ATP-binding cassette domain-containing protein [bacterium]
FSIENIIILYLCTKMIINPKEIFSLGMMYAFLQYKGQFTGAISSLVDNFFQVKMMKLHLERLADIALEDTDPCFDDKQRDKLTTPIKGSIRVSNLSFRYDAFEPLLFQNLNFEIKEGESVALIGPSGCGKSTLMKILIGLLESTSGDIFIDDIKLADRQLAHYRESIASVMQNDSLLAGSIRENIAFFDENINDQYVEYCAQLAAIDQDIKAMPMGYHTLVGELGSQISGGQQQRILLARALYKKPRILFLDEATSHLDLATEHAVSTAIAHLNITRVIIAHRPETIKTADRLLVLQAGNLVEQGKSSS